MTRTYDRRTFEAARQGWDAGGFGPEWAELRRLSWERGYPFPPHGSAHDDRDADEPSRRAIVYAALRDHPAAVHAIVGRSSSWADVVDRIIGLERRLREDAELSEREAAWEREHRPTHQEAVMSLAAVLRRIEESAP